MEIKQKIKELQRLRKSCNLTAEISGQPLGAHYMTDPIVFKDKAAIRQLIDTEIAYYESKLVANGH